MTEKFILSEINKLYEDILLDRRRLHGLAEVGFELHKTADYVESVLEGIGLQPRRFGRCGIGATVGTAGKCFLLRADMDALPLVEQTGLVFASAGDAMHACGHDMHTAMMLGAARFFAGHQKDICGRIKFMFQPAEELLAGASDMISAGILEDPKADAGMMLHVIPSGNLRCGTLIISSEGESAPAASFFKISIIGRSCHGSSAKDGIDPIIPAAHIITALESIKTKEISPDIPFSLSLGKVTAGSAANVLPETATLEGSIRCFDENILKHVRKRIEDIAMGISESLRASAKVEWTASCPALVNDKDMSDLALKTALSLFGKSKVFTSNELAQTGKTLGGSEDFSYVASRIPSVMVGITATDGDNGPYPLHHPKVIFSESVMKKGTALACGCAINWLRENA